MFCNWAPFLPLQWNALAYRAHSLVKEKMKCCEYGHWCFFGWQFCWLVMVVLQACLFYLVNGWVHGGLFLNKHLINVVSCRGCQQSMHLPHRYLREIDCSRHISKQKNPLQLSKTAGSRHKQDRPTRQTGQHGRQGKTRQTGQQGRQANKADRPTRQTGQQGRQANMVGRLCE